jgi:large subunit ribosomal protein L39e
MCGSGLASFCILLLEGIVDCIGVLVRLGTPSNCSDVSMLSPMAKRRYKTLVAHKGLAWLTDLAHHTSEYPVQYSPRLQRQHIRHPTQQSRCRYESTSCPSDNVDRVILTTLQSHKSFRTKQKLARAQKQNRPIPQWIRLRTGNTIRYAANDTAAIEPSSEE